MRRNAKKRIKSLITLVGVLLLTGTIFYNQIEGFSIIDAFYFSVTTLSTVGYGDLVPHSTFGKLFTTFYILIGVGILLETLNLITKLRLEKHHHKLTEKIKEEIRNKENSKKNKK